MTGPFLLSTSVFAFSFFITFLFGSVRQITLAVRIGYRIVSQLYSLVVTCFILRTYFPLLVNQASTYLCSLLIIIHVEESVIITALCNETYLTVL